MSSKLPDALSEPLESFESSILAFQRGELPIFDLLREFMDTQLVLPSAAEATSLQAIEPVIWHHDGAIMVGVFTHPDRAIPYAAMAPNIAQMSGRKVIGIINKDVGLLVNPGSEEFSFVIPPIAVTSMRTEFGV